MSVNPKYFAIDFFFKFFVRLAADCRGASLKAVVIFC